MFGKAASTIRRKKSNALAAEDGAREGGGVSVLVVAGRMVFAGMQMTLSPEGSAASVPLPLFLGSVATGAYRCSMQNNR